MPGRRITAIAAISATVSAVPAAQDQRPTFRATTRLVEVSVVVHDRDGRPVAGLTASDFKISEDGKPQAIELFAVQDARENETVSVNGPPLVVGVPSVRSSMAPSPEQTDFSNWREGRNAGVTAILIDRVNSVDVDQKAARDQLVKFLEQIHQEDTVALYVLESSSIRVLHDFTTDTSALLKSLSRYRARANGDPEGNTVVGPDTGDPEVDAFLRESETVNRARIIRNRAEVTAAGMETLARHLNGIQGRKNLVWITSGFPLISQDEIGRPIVFSGETGRAMRALSDANIAVYPLDDRRIPGYFPLPVTGPSPMIPSRGPATTGVTPPSTFATTAPNQDSMQRIADATGGRAFLHTNDLTDAIRRAADDARFTYVLGYYPAQTKWDGTFHHVTVNVARPGVSVRYRSGYVATQTPAKIALTDTARNPLEATGLRLSAHVARIAAAASAASDLQITIRLEPSSVTLTKTSATWDGSLEIL
ncbi:MAG TPA: VWA domain-containing protein, partial [Vicinamibacterales bacterium]|nr:VWA domain-containing protein [Vicinamibacterales bacterium]